MKGIMLLTSLPSLNPRSRFLSVGYPTIWYVVPAVSLLCVTAIFPLAFDSQRFTYPFAVPALLPGLFLSQSLA